MFILRFYHDVCLCPYIYIFTMILCLVNILLVFIIFHFLEKWKLKTCWYFLPNFWLVSRFFFSRLEIWVDMGKIFVCQFLAATSWFVHVFVTSHQMSQKMSKKILIKKSRQSLEEVRHLEKHLNSYDINIRLVFPKTLNLDTIFSQKSRFLTIANKILKTSLNLSEKDCNIYCFLIKFWCLFQIWSPFYPIRKRFWDNDTIFLLFLPKIGKCGTSISKSHF